MFLECKYLTSLDLNKYVTTKAENMNRMFQECNNLVELKISSWNTENVINMSSMFASCPMTSLDIQNFNTRKVKD